MPPSNGTSVALTTQAMLAAGASKPRNRRALALVNAATASGSGVAVFWLARGSGLPAQARAKAIASARSEEHTSELQSLMRISYAVFCLKKKKNRNKITHETTNHVT